MKDSFPSQGFITGPQILKFCDIQQVNYFIIKNLMVEWKREIDKLKSPYFDYESKEVSEAMEQYANILSRHIKISKEPFLKLLNDSVREAISLMTTPYEFYIAFASEAGEKNYSEEELREIGKYIKHNKFIYSEFIERAIGSGLKSGEYRKQVESVFNETKESPEDPTRHIQSFNSILKLDPEILLESMEGGKEEEKTPATPEQKSDQNTLHDSLRGGSVKSIADLHEEKKVENIRASLNLNQRFMFINGLFEGNEEHFNQTIDKLEKLDNVEDVRQYLVDELKWDDGQEEVEEFLQLISKRLA